MDFAEKNAAGVRFRDVAVQLDNAGEPFCAGRGVRT